MKRRYQCGVRIATPYLTAPNRPIQVRESPATAPPWKCHRFRPLFLLASKTYMSRLLSPSPRFPLHTQPLPSVLRSSLNMYFPRTILLVLISSCILFAASTNSLPIPDRSLEQPVPPSISQSDPPTVAASFTEEVRPRSPSRHDGEHKFAKRRRNVESGGRVRTEGDSAPAQPESNTPPPSAPQEFVRKRRSNLDKRHPATPFASTGESAPAQLQRRRLHKRHPVMSFKGSGRPVKAPRPGRVQAPQAQNSVRVGNFAQKLPDLPDPDYSVPQVPVRERSYEARADRNVQNTGKLVRRSKVMGAGGGRGYQSPPGSFRPAPDSQRAVRRGYVP